MREGPCKRIQPFADSRLTPVDFLTTTDQTNNNSPVRMTIQAGNQKLGLGLIEVRASLLSLHKRRGLFQCPGSLRFVEDRDMLQRRSFGLYQTIVSKMMDVLDERLYLA